MLGFLLLSMASNVRAESQEERALYWLDHGSCKFAGDVINDGIENDAAWAYRLAASLYTNSGCVDHDEAKATRLYRRAVGLGDRESRFLLGVRTALGLGTEQNYLEAGSLFNASKNDVKTMSPEAVIANACITTFQHLVRNSAIRYPRERFGDEKPPDVNVLWRIDLKTKERGLVDATIQPIDGRALTLTKQEIRYFIDESLTSLDRALRGLPPCPPQSKAVLIEMPFHFAVE